MVCLSLRVSAIVLLIYGGSAVSDMVRLHEHADQAHPAAGQGLFACQRAAPARRFRLNRTQAVMQEVENIALKTPGIRHTVGISGESILLNANAPNFGATYLMLDEFGKRIARRFPPTQLPRPWKPGFRMTSLTR